MSIKPLYRFDNKILVGLEVDFRELCVIDGLVVELDLDDKNILHHPWSGQKKLRLGIYSPIRNEHKIEIKRRIERKFRRKIVNQIIDMLTNPTGEQIESLIWKPDRLNGS